MKKQSKYLPNVGGAIFADMLTLEIVIYTSIRGIDYNHHIPPIDFQTFLRL